MPKRSFSDVEPSSALTISPPLSPAASPSVTPEPEYVRETKFTRSVSPAVKPVIMTCDLPGHKILNFATYEDYEVHYKKDHMNRCLECGRNFPTAHYFELHITENHDPIAQEKRKRGEKIYACFVQGCDKICAEPIRRKWHLKAKHGFRDDYNFYIVNDGIDAKKSMLHPSYHRSRSSSNVTISTTNSRACDAPVSDKPKNEAKAPDQTPSDAMEGITSSLSALKFIPHSVTFGRGSASGGFAKSRGSNATGTKLKNETDAAQSNAMEGVTSSTSALRFIPASVRLGRGGVAKR